MHITFMASGFGPAIPEIILAVGVLVLVLVGAFRGEGSSVVVGTGAFVVLLIALLAVGLTPPARTTTLGGAGSSRRRRPPPLSSTPTSRSFTR